MHTLIKLSNYLLVKNFLTFALLAFTSCWAPLSFAYDVEADSIGNKVYILLINDNPTASYDSIAINYLPPGIVTSASASIIPASVAAGGSDLAALDFDIDPSAVLGASGNLDITVIGSINGQSVNVELSVPLLVVTNVAAAQGEVGSTIPAPDPGGVDSDNDGISDALEIAFDSNPFNPESLPGVLEAVNVPLFGILGAASLAILLLISGSSAKRRRNAGLITMTAIVLLPLDLIAGTATRIQLVAHIPVPPPLPQLLAATATASTTGAAGGAAFAVDGNINSRWESQHGIDPQTITLDLGEAYALDEVIIHWEAANAASYRIDGSLDGTNWTTSLANFSGGAWDPGTGVRRTDTLSVAGNYRYVRMYGQTRPSGNVYGYSIWEMEVYGLPAADEDNDGVGDSADLCPGTPAGSEVDVTGCIIIDTTPDAFTFTPIIDAPLNTLSVSNSITVSGIAASTTISIDSGEYAINGGAYLSTSSFVDNDDTAVVRQTSSANFSATSQVTLTIGGVSAPFNVTTLANPNSFGFLDQNNVAQNSLVTSNAILVSAINEPATISVANGKYSIDGGAFTAIAGTISNGQILSLQQTTSTLPSTQIDTVLTVDGITDTFSVTTSAVAIPTDQVRAGNIDGVTVWQLPDAPNGDKPDQCWLAVGSDIDGEIYISGHDHINNSMLYRLHQSDDVVRWVGDAQTASEAVSNWLPGETAEKFHTRPLEHDGHVYVATLDSSNMNSDYLNTRGFHWYGYEQANNALLDLSVSEPNGVGAPNIQIVTIQKDVQNNLLYGMSIPENKLVRYDIANGQTTVLGKPNDWTGFFYSNRFMWVDSRGRVYMTGGSSRNQWNQGESASTFDHVWYYDPATGFGELNNFAMQGANALEVGQWDRAREVLYTADDQGNIYRFVDSTAAWNFVGQANFSGVSGVPKTWVFQLSADAKKIYIGVSDVSYPNSIWEFDIATGTTSELAKISELDTVASSQDFITGYDSWDNNGSFYISNFSMFNGVNTFMLGINPVRIKAVNDNSFDLVEVSSQATANGVSISRTGVTTDALEVLYEIRLFDALGARLDILIGETTIVTGQSNIALSTASLGLPPAATFAYAEFGLVADGNDYVLANNFKVILD